MFNPLQLIQLGWDFIFKPSLVPGMTLADVIFHENVPCGPLPHTGGVINRISMMDAVNIANLITQTCETYKLDVPLVAAWLCIEGRFDPKARNPNNQHAKKGDDTHAIFLRSDIGIAQFDGRWLEADFPHTEWQHLESLALDPAWAIPYFGFKVRKLLDWAADQKVDSEIHREGLAVQAYNSGQEGALALYANRQPFPYAVKVLDKAIEYGSILGAS